MNDQPTRNRPRLIGVVAIVLVLGIGLAVLASLSLDDGSEEQIEITGAQEVQGLIGGIRQQGDRLGNDDAPVTVEVFNDLQCEPCGDYHLETIDPLIEDEVRAGDVKLIFRHYSQDADRVTGVGGLGAEAAGLQDDQWQFIELFYRNQDEIKDGSAIGQDFLDGVARAIIEFNVEQWQRDFDNQEVLDALEEDDAAAIARRLPLEPAVVVTGNDVSRELIEAPSLEEIRRAIDEASG